MLNCSHGNLVAPGNIAPITGWVWFSNCLWVMLGCQNLEVCVCTHIILSFGLCKHIVCVCVYHVVSRVTNCPLFMLSFSHYYIIYPSWLWLCMCKPQNYVGIVGDDIDRGCFSLSLTRPWVACLPFVQLCVRCNNPTYNREASQDHTLETVAVHTCCTKRYQEGLLYKHTFTTCNCI